MSSGSCSTPPNLVAVSGRTLIGMELAIKYGMTGTADARPKCCALPDSGHRNGCSTIAAQGRCGTLNP